MSPPIDSNELRILALLLAPPDQDALDALRDVRDRVPWLDPCLPELEGLGLGHWQAEHTRLFVNGYPKTACPPYESAYRHGTMGGPCCAELADLYARAGLAATEAPPDYLGTLLECAAYLEDCGMGDLGEELVTEHLQLWVPRFAADLAGQAEVGLYRALGHRIGVLFPEAADHE